MVGLVDIDAKALEIGRKHLGLKAEQFVGGPLGLPSSDDLWLAENIRELRSVLEAAAIRCEGDWIKAEHLPPLGDANADAPHPHPGDEREWILNALQRHRSRRGEAARYLGISRKTYITRCALMVCHSSQERSSGTGCIPSSRRNQS